MSEEELQLSRARKRWGYGVPHCKGGGVVQSDRDADRAACGRQTKVPFAIAIVWCSSRTYCSALP